MPDNITYEEFLKLVPSHLSHLCRLRKSILNQISFALANRTIERKKVYTATYGRVLTAKRTTSGKCWACRAQQYEYANHLVTIDTVGRCVEPAIINNQQTIANLAGTNKDLKISMSRSRYSLEYVFTMGSVPNVFIDLIRDFYHRKDRQIGLMTAAEDWNTFYKYLRVLFNELLTMLANEKKLIKLNAPSIVVGDLLGSLHDLMQVETNFFLSFPIVPENLIFLGNYSGHRGYSIECLIYLFCLKLCSPNKVILLRGANELSSQSGSETLLQEAIVKYGQTNGTIIYQLLVEIFARLPIVSLVDERILCVHSGFPSGGNIRLSELLNLSKDLPHLVRDAPAASEVSFFIYLLFCLLIFIFTSSTSPDVQL